MEMESSFASMSRDSDSESRSYLKKCIGVVILCSSILGGSSIGVMNNYIPVQSPFAKNAWRNGLVCVYFAIPALIENIIYKAKFKITL
jgi:hypothetical protein